MPRLKPHHILAALGAGALTLEATNLLATLFSPAPALTLTDPITAPLDSEPFLHFLATLTDSTRRPARLTRLLNGREFYPAYLAAIMAARHTLHLEFYEFLPGRITSALLDALTARARAGVRVRLLVDAIGSFGIPASYFADFRRAGGQMVWYHPLTDPAGLAALNNRTHRKLLIADTRIAFLGGAGIADHWLMPTKKPHRPFAAPDPTWRDTMFSLEGPAIAGLTSTFAENWLEATGEILSTPTLFTLSPDRTGDESLILPSTPRGGGTQARILFQALIASARSTIRITTPYFLPDRPAIAALIAAVRRGVSVQILTAGPHIDHAYIRTLSRHLSRPLLAAGATIHEYQPAMLHAKLMTIDGLWSVLGSTNFDHRSFALNDEVNLATLSPTLTRTLDHDFAQDLHQSHPLTPRTAAAHTPLSTATNLLEDAVSPALEHES